MHGRKTEKNWCGVERRVNERPELISGWSASAGKLGAQVEYLAGCTQFGSHFWEEYTDLALLFTNGWDILWNFDFWRPERQSVSAFCFVFVAC